jgi:hypothetical protein
MDTHRPPHFDGTNFPYYSARMACYLEAVCKENGPRAIWLIEFWCLMNNTIRELISFLVFVFVVHRMRREFSEEIQDEGCQPAPGGAPDIGVRCASDCPVWHRTVCAERSQTGVLWL